MNQKSYPGSGGGGGPPPLSRLIWGFAVACILLVVAGLLRAGRKEKHVSEVASSIPAETDAAGGSLSSLPSRPPRTFSPVSTLTPEEIVAGKVSQFGRSRRNIARGIGKRLQKQVPSEVEKFFDAVEAGKWEDIKAQWDKLSPHSAQYESSSNHWEEMDPFWPAVLDAYGAAEQAHLWPAQKLLDYGNAILDSLRPGMVYVGGTDNGRWIPEILNETSDGEQHVILTQNALADSRYLDFVNTLYGDRLTTLNADDSQAAFQSYVADAQKRLEHDLQFPDEPKQVHRGEDIQMSDGKVQVGGQVSVMLINASLLQRLMQKNPDLSFALQESFPLRSTYPDAVPLGPIMELGARDPQAEFTPERAAQSLQYWQAAAQQLLEAPQAADSQDTLKAYSHDTVAAANLLAAHNFNGEAEQAYRLASQLWPENPEPVSGLADLLVGAGHQSEAKQLLQDFARQHPTQQQDLQRISFSWQLLMTPGKTAP